MTALSVWSLVGLLCSSKPHTHEIVGSINWTQGFFFFLNRGHEVWRVRRVREILEKLGEMDVGDMIEIQCREFSKN